MGVKVRSDKLVTVRDVPKGQRDGIDDDALARWKAKRYAVVQEPKADPDKVDGFLAKDVFFVCRTCFRTAYFHPTAPAALVPACCMYCTPKGLVDYAATLGPTGPYARIKPYNNTKVRNTMWSKTEEELKEQRRRDEESLRRAGWLKDPEPAGKGPAPAKPGAGKEPRRSRSDKDWAGCTCGTGAALINAVLTRKWMTSGEIDKRAKAGRDSRGHLRALIHRGLAVRHSDGQRYRLSKKGKALKFGKGVGE